MTKDVDVDIKAAAVRLEALGHPIRLAAFRLLIRAGSQGRTVGQLQESLDIPASTLSHHLRKLIAVGLISQEREGTTLICCTNDEVMEKTIGFLVRECCADDLSNQMTSTIESD